MKGSRKLISGLRTTLLCAALALCVQGVGAQDEVYRIVVQQDVPEKEARDYKLHMEGLGFVPVVLGDFKDGRATVFYGNFAQKPEAEKARNDLKRSNIGAIAIIRVKRDAAAGGDGSFTLVVDEFRQRNEADALKKKLEGAGHLNVEVKQQSGVYYVSVGRYPSENTARNVGASLKNEGHDKVQAVEVNRDGTLRVAAPAGGGAGEVDYAAIAATVGKSLSDDQKKEVAKLIEEQVKLARSSSGDSAMAERLREIESRLSGLDVKVAEVESEIAAERARREQEARKTVEVASIMRDAEVLARSGKLDDAIAKMDMILQIEPNNNMAIVRKRMWEDMKANPDGGDKPESDRYDRYKNEAVKAEQVGDGPSLNTARTLWVQIKGLSENYEEEANAALAGIDAKLAALAPTAPPPTSNIALLASAGVAVVVLVLGLIFFLRSRKERREILAKIQQATEMRPMRSIPGGRRASDWQLMAPGATEGSSPDPLMGGPIGGGPGGGGTGDDLFSGGDVDPLAATTRNAPTPPPPPRPAPSADAGFDDILGGGSSGGTDFGGGSGGGMDFGGGSSGGMDFGGMDFGGSQPQAAPQPAPRPAPAAAAASGSDLDDILAGLGGGAPASQPAPAAASDDFGLGDIFNNQPAPKPAPRAAAPQPEPSALSLDDLLGGGSPAPARGGSDSFAGTPFESLLGGGPAPKAAAQPSTLDFPALGGSPLPSDPIGGFGLGLGDETIIERPDLGAPPAPGGFGAIAGEAPTSANGEVFVQDFEGDAVGAKPASWAGEYPYATLTVENEAPTKGSRNYLAYRKKEGVGKVYYSTRFPNVGGVVSVEFDLCCNDKNKFLLGFYVEKDEDFQQSIHTKILRSESQTAPSIHIHGQPAPYLLGTWAHIKYVVDLNEGKVDGYVDDRHVAKGVALTQVPKYLNTLAIRDNINTTGNLFIDNVVVRKLG